MHFFLSVEGFFFFAFLNVSLTFAGGIRWRRLRILCLVTLDRQCALENERGRRRRSLFWQSYSSAVELCCCTVAAAAAVAEAFVYRHLLFFVGVIISPGSKKALPLASCFLSINSSAVCWIICWEKLGVSKQNPDRLQGKMGAGLITRLEFAFPECLLFLSTV